MKLTDVACKNAKAEGKVRKMSDGGGLYLEVTAAGGKYWRLKYRFNGKENRLSFGVYPEVSLLEAREKRRIAKKQLDSGSDPSEVKKLVKLEHKINYANNFEALAREWHSKRKDMWQPKHADTILNRLEDNLFPIIGSRPIKLITPPELLEAIRPIEKAGKHEMAHRMLQTSGQIFRYAVASGRAERDITQDLRGALAPVRSKHYAHLSEKEMPAFLNKLERYEADYNGSTLTKLAFKLLILTFVRSGEIRGAKWSEIDFDKAQWRIPKERMKMKEQHIVPLSRQSTNILKQIHNISGDGVYVLPSQKESHKIMSENTFLRAIEIMGYKDKTTAHGFRSTASTVLNENGFNPDWIERQLAHAERDQIRAAYNHAYYLKERTEMMQWWADYIEKLMKGKGDGIKTKTI